MPHSLPLRRPSAGLAGLYDRMATTWQSNMDRLGFPSAYEHLFRAARPAPAAHVLDIGTGTGAFARAYLDETGHRPDRLTLLDTSNAMLAEAARALDTRSTQVDGLHDAIGTAAIAPNRYDLILAAHVFEHLPDPDDALAWTFDRLRPGGQVVFAISRPHWCTALIRWRWGHAAWAPDVVGAMLAREGFFDIRHIPFASGPPARTSAGYVATKSP